MSGRPMHVCGAFSNQSEQSSWTVPYILDGMDRNEKCVCIVDRSTKEELFRAVLKARDVGQDALEKRLTFLTSDEVYLKDGRFAMGRMLKTLTQLEHGALAEGYIGLRGVGEMTWATRKAPGVGDLVEYEARINYMYPQARSNMLCQYDEPSFDPATMLDVVTVHPKVVLKGSLCYNPFYQPPDDFLARKRGTVLRSVYDRTVREISRRARLAELHHGELKDLRRANQRLFMLNDVAFHDIWNEVSVMSFLSELALDSCADQKTRGYLQELAGKVAAVQKQLDFARAYQLVGPSEQGWHDIAQLVEDAALALSSAAYKIHKKLPKAEILADDMFAGVFVALLENVPGVRKDSAKVEISSSESEEGLVVSISVEGRGVPSAQKQRVFSRDFFDEGCDGHQLFLAGEIARSSGISLSETGVPGKNTRFEVRIPKERYRPIS